MENQKIFDSYDMVVPMKQEMINDQLTHLQKMRVIKRKLIIVQKIDGNDYDYKVLDSADDIPRDDDGNPTNSYINATIHPQIKIEESGSKVIFVLEFKGGDAAFWKGIGPGAKLKKYDISDWTYGVAVDLGLEKLEKKDITKGIKVPDNVKKQLHDFSEDMFRIDHLFMDFESAHLMQPDETETNTPGDTLTKQLAGFMHFYLLDIQRKGNPYILGYSLNTSDKTKMPKKVPDSLKPTGTTFNTFYDRDHPDQSTLNFILVTKGGNKEIKHQPDPFDSNWIRADEQCDAKMIYSHKCLLEKYMLEPFFDKLRNGIYDNIKDHISVGKGHHYEKAKHQHHDGMSYNISHNHHGHNQYENKFRVKIKNKKSRVDLKFKGHVRIYKKKTKDFGVCTAKAYAEGKVDWEGTVSIKSKKDSNGKPTLKLETHGFKAKSHHNTHKNDCAKVWKVIGDILGAIIEGFTFFADGGFMMDLMDEVFNLKVPYLGDVGGVFAYLPSAPQTVIMLPAGQEFFFKNPESNAQGDFGLELTYKSQN